MQHPLRTAYRTLAGVIGLVSVGWLYGLVVLDGGPVLSGSVRYFSFFTILTNLLAAAAMLLPVWAPATRAGAFLDRPAVRTAIAGYIIVVGVVYYALLRNVGNAQGWELFLNQILHYVLPPMFALDWLIFVPKRSLPWRTGIDCLAFPAVYAAWTLTHGAVTGWYPYPFLDVTDLGYAQTLVNLAGLVLAFLALELALVAIGRALARGAPPSS
jgi:hypothetical protein